MFKILQTYNHISGIFRISNFIDKWHRKFPLHKKPSCLIHFYLFNYAIIILDFCAH